MDDYISIFKMDPNDPLNRKEIAQIPTDYLVYQHGMAVSEDYIIVYQNPLSIDMIEMLKGKDMSQCMVLNEDKKAKIHAVKISDGSITSFDTGVWGLTLHFSNAY